jgi:anti-sigma regulatory factor (Ser/Thr protein kinase)
MTLVVDADPAEGSGFHHEALFYATHDEFLAGTLPFILKGVDTGEPVLVLVPEPRLTSLRTALEGAAAAVRFADMGLVGRNPARIIPVWQDFVDDHGGQGRSVRGVGEPIWAGRTPDEIVECQVHETLLNVAFAGPEPVSVLCPYDVAALDPSIRREAQRSHRWLNRDGTHSKSSAFREIDTDTAPFGAPLRPAPEEARVEGFDGANLRSLRRFVAAFAADAGLAHDRADDLVLAVSEIATNSVCHGGGSGTLHAWLDDETVVCQISDRGRIKEPLAGRRRPRADQPSGRGLWLANHLCDLVQIRVAPHGSIIRIHQRGPLLPPR